MGLFTVKISTEINSPFHHQRNIINASSSTHTHHANKAQEMHKTQETHISNREGKSHRVEKQSMSLLCFFQFVWFMWKKHSKPDFWENGFGFAVYGLLCIGLQCLVYGKNAGVVVFYGWVAWRRDWEGNGPEGRLRLEKRIVILCCDSGNSLMW